MQAERLAFAYGKVRAFACVVVQGGHSVELGFTGDVRRKLLVFELCLYICGGRLVCVEQKAPRVVPTS